MLAKMLIVGLLSVALISQLPNKQISDHINNSDSKRTTQTVQAKLASKHIEVSPQPPTTAEQEIVTTQSNVVTEEPNTPKAIAQVKAAERGWVGSEWDALVELWHKESGWNPQAYNASSGACGIPQALPCSKIPNPSDVSSQIDWGLDYISSRYGSPTKALNFWHNEAPAYNGSNWY